MKNQTLSIEQMKHLQDLGVDVSKASMVYQTYKDTTDEWIKGDEFTPGHFKIDESSKAIIRLDIRSSEECLYNDLSECSNCSCCEIIPAFTLQDICELFENVKYKSVGFPIMFFDYNYSFRHWELALRNPSGFENPIIKENTPIDAAYKMLCWLAENDYLNKEEQ